VEGFVLAGGRASRFGSNKALALWRGKALIAYPLEALRRLGLVPRIVTRDPFPYRAWGQAFVLGEEPDQGPVGAVKAVLEGAAAPWCLVLCADMPGVEPRHLRALLAGIPSERSREPSAEGAAMKSFDRSEGAPEVRGVCFRDRSGRPLPFPGLYHRSLLPAVSDLGRNAAMQSLLALPSIRVARLALSRSDDPDEVFRNVNREKDLDP
jgi:molybdopterin-guanine dinucleotide biosynthesis protein A